MAAVVLRTESALSSSLSQVSAGIAGAGQAQWTHRLLAKIGSKPEAKQKPALASIDARGR